MEVSGFLWRGNRGCGVSGDCGVGQWRGGGIGEGKDS